MNQPGFHGISRLGFEHCSGGFIIFLLQNDRASSAWNDDLAASYDMLMAVPIHPTSWLHSGFQVFIFAFQGIRKKRVNVILIANFNYNIKFHADLISLHRVGQIRSRVGEGGQHSNTHLPGTRNALISKNLMLWKVVLKPWKTKSRENLLLGKAGFWWPFGGVMGLEH